MIGKIISHYKILEKLGEGGMGVVYKAQDTKLNRIVALKFLSPQVWGADEERLRFFNEAQAAAALDHPNICTIYEINEAEGHTFISMACIEGQSLKDKIKSGSLQMTEVLDIAIQVAEGLQEAHEKGIVHRDIKSGNIMVTEKGQAKIMDFGLAKLTGEAQITKTDTAMGTVAYMSPEQAKGEEVDQRTDIWALGVVLYEMLTGQMPFKGEHEQAVIYSILNSDPQPITELRKGLPGSLHTVVKKSLTKDPAQRYQSAGEMLTDLQAVKQGCALTEKSWLKKATREKKGRAILISLIVVLALILTVLLMPHKEEQIPGKISKIPIGVMFFDNQTGEIKYNYLRKVLADMLITDLSQSRYLQVVTFQRMYDLLKSLGHEDVEIIDASMGFELCELAGVHAMVLGSLTKSGDTFVINTQVLDVHSKKQIAAYRVTGKGENSILGHLVDDLTDEIKKGMEVSLKEIQQEKKTITELTTSLEAYRYYSAGRESAYRMYHQEAIDNFERAVALDPAFIEAYDALARQYYETHDHTKALEIIEEVKSFPDNLTEEDSIEILALEAYIKHDWNLAINYYKRLVAIDPENIHAHIDLGMAYTHGNKMYDEGISEFEKALELDPKGVTENRSFAYNVLGWAYLRKGDLKKAREAFERYVDLLPNQPHPLNCIAEFYLFAGYYDQAIATLQQSLRIKSDFRVTHGDLGDTYLAKGIFSQAFRSYERFLDLSPGKSEKAEGHFLFGKLHYLKDDHTKAVFECQQALKLDPQMIEAHWILGLAFVKQEMFDQADSEVLSIKGLIEEPKDDEEKIPYYHLLGELSLSQGLDSQALDNLNQAASIWSLERAFYTTALGEAYYKIGKLDKAIEKFQAVLQINPNYAQTHYLLGLVYEKKNITKKAKHHFQECMAVWKDADEDLPQLMDAKRKLEKL